MDNAPENLADDDRYFTHLAAAFVRGSLNLPPNDTRPTATLIQEGVAAGLRLHKFKRQTALPRVQKVLGLLRGLQPENLLDTGSGRGTFLWPLVAEFPALPITAIDTNPLRVENLEAVRRGGISNLTALEMDAHDLEFAPQEFDVVTLLEVLEHLPAPAQAAREAVRVARRFVIVSVPSQPDDNPEHTNLFTSNSLTALFKDAGARQVKLQQVLNHFIAVVGKR